MAKKKLSSMLNGRRKRKKQEPPREGMPAVTVRPEKSKRIFEPASRIILVVNDDEGGTGCVDTANGNCSVTFLRDITERERLKAALKRDHEQIRDLALRLISAQEEERRRVSREIHDDFCQELAALAFDLGELLVEPLPEASLSRLQELQGRLVNLSSAARTLAYKLHPSTLEDLGLAASLSGLCAELSLRNGMVVKFTKGQVPDGLPLEVTSCLYRIAQEGLRNAVKHSGAKHVAVRLRSNRKNVMVSVRDDGVGFDVRSAKGKGGLGLASMGERVRLVDGNLSIESAPGHGTSIVATAPLLRRGA